MLEPSGALSVVRAAPGDLPAMLMLERTCHNDPWPERAMADVFVGLGQANFVARFGTSPVCGFVCARITLDELEIHDLCVDRDARRLGVGTALMRTVLERAGSMRVTCAYLEVRAGNTAAIALYQRLGFHTERNRKEYYRDGEDALIMTAAAPFMSRVE